jgi:uncharacterized membrane protein YcaP (DUF421 family)
MRVGLTSTGALPNSTAFDSVKFAEPLCRVRDPLHPAHLRSAAKLNIFDFVVTVALGSTLATILLSSDVSFAEGAVGLAVLIALQYLVATASSRSATLQGMVKSEPTLVVRRGEVLHDALAKERLGVEEVHQALRGSGVADVGDVAAVVLETDGSLSVIADAGRGASALRGVRGW